MLCGQARLMRLARWGQAIVQRTPLHRPSLSLACQSWSSEALSRTLQSKERQQLAFYSYNVGLEGNVRPVTDGTVKVESGFAELKLKLERLGHLRLRDIDQVVVSLEQCSNQLTDANCLSLLQYCCMMAEEEYRPCGPLVQRVWTLTAHRPNACVSLEHLEYYLHLCLVVDSSTVSERDVFGVLEKHGLQPSTKIFEVLMTALGQRGQLEEAVRVVSIMKDYGVPVREPTFAALILGYGAKHDWHGIQGVLDAMRSVKMQSSEVTYGALAITHAKTGEVARLGQVVAEAKDNNKPLSSGQLESSLLALIRSDNAGNKFENIDAVLRLVKENDVKLDLSRMALCLIHSGHVREAVHLLLTLPVLRTKTQLYSNGAVYLQEIVHARTDPDLVVEVCHQLRREDINRYALHVALECALRHHWEQLAWVLLYALKAAHEPLREHYFWPLLNLKAISQSPQELLDIVKSMVELDVTPGVETLRDYIIPALNLTEPSLSLQMLHNAGLSAKTTALPLLLVLIRNNMMKHAMKFVREIRLPLPLGDIIGTLASAWHANPKPVIALLAQLIHHKETKGEDWGGRFLLRLAATRTGLDVHSVHPLFMELRKHKIGISALSADQLMNRLSQPLQEVVQDSLSLVLKEELKLPPEEHKNNAILHPKNMNSEELECHLEELRAKGLNIRGSLRRLLLLRAAKKDFAGVMKLMQSAKESGYKVSGGMMSSMLEVYVRQHNTEAAVGMLAYLHTHHPTFTMDLYKIIDLCTLLIKDKKAPEAIHILEEQMKIGFKNIDLKNVRRNCYSLLMTAANNNTPEEVKELFELLLLGGYVVPDRLILGTLVKCRLNRGDLSGAVQEARRLHETFNCLPMRKELLIHLISNNTITITSDSESTTTKKLLDEMLRLIASVRSPLLAQHDLFFSYLEAGRPSEAIKVFKSIGRNLNQTEVSNQLKYYIRSENEAALVHLLTATQGSLNIDRHSVYSALLSIYYVKSDGMRGLSLWTSMQQEELPAQPSFLSTLAGLLASCKMKIPFEL